MQARKVWPPQYALFSHLEWKILLLLGGSLGCLSPRPLVTRMIYVILRNNACVLYGGVTMRDGGWSLSPVSWRSHTANGYIATFRYTTELPGPLFQMEIEWQRELGTEGLMDEDCYLAECNLGDLEETSGMKWTYWLLAIKAAREASRLKGI